MEPTQHALDVAHALRQSYTRTFPQDRLAEPLRCVALDHRWMALQIRDKAWVMDAHTFDEERLARAEREARIDLELPGCEDIAMARWAIAFPQQRLLSLEPDTQKWIACRLRALQFADVDWHDSVPGYDGYRR